MAERRAVAVIPARGGSKGLPRKNVRPLAGVPLIGRTVLAARAATTLAGVYVSTDDSEIAAAASAYGAEIIPRPEALASDTASSEAALLHALSWLDERAAHPQVLVFLQCTSPFTKASDIDDVARAVLDDGFDSALSVVPTHGFLWRENADGVAVGVNHDAGRPRRLRQERPPEFQENGAVYAMAVAAFRAAKTRFCGRSRLVVTTMPTLEIDSLADFEIAEAMLEKRPCPDEMRAS